MSDVTLSNKFDGNLYQRYRPSYPKDLIDYITGQCMYTNMAWDCCTGTGIVANLIADKFTQIIATDISKSQISHAIQKPNIEYRIESLANTTLPASSIDLITVAQAYHWLDPELFYRKAYDALHHNGVVAIWCYTRCLNHDLEEITKQFMLNSLDGLDSDDGKTFINNWDWIKSGYNNLQLPFRTYIHKKFLANKVFNLSNYTGYLESISSSIAYTRMFGESPVKFIRDELLKIWENPNKTLDLQWEISLHIFKK